MWSPGLISDRSTRFDSSPIPAASQRVAEALRSHPRRLYGPLVYYAVHGREQAGRGGWSHGEWLRVGERALYREPEGRGV